MTARRKIFQIAASFALIIGFAGCGESPSHPLEPTAEQAGLLGGTLRVLVELLPILDTTSEQVIGPEGGTLAIAGGHSLHFPAGALADTVTIRAVRDPARILVTFGPQGLVFPDSALPTLTYSYDGVGVLGLLGPVAPVIVYLEGGAIVEQLPTVVDDAAKVARARLRHFSTYALATD